MDEILGEEEAHANGVEDWATDMVVTELRRAYPAAISKGGLEEATGIGPGSLRSVVAYLLEEGQITEGAVDGDDGWRYLQVEERALSGVLTAGEGEDDGSPLPPPGEPDVDGVLPERLHPGHAADTRYGATITIEVFYHPEPIDDESGDQAARRESGLIEEAAVGGILAMFPGLGVTVDANEVVAYDRPRTVA